MYYPKKNGFIDRTGFIYTRLTVLEYDPELSKPKLLYWKCLCECGNIVSKKGINLISGYAKSCGCLNLDTFKLRKLKKVTDTTEYQSWESMNQRCNNPNHNSYHYCGANGISICERWSGEDGFKNFLKDMGLKPTPKHTIDRIDSKGNYEPSNCRWATRTQQNKNTSRNVWYEYNGTRMVQSDWLRMFNISYFKLNRYLKTNTFEDAYLNFMKNADLSS